MNGPMYVYETVIGASAERIWAALTTAEFTQRYFHCTAVESDWQAGSAVIYRNPDDSPAVEGEVLESEPPRHLVISWRPLYSREMAAEPPSRVSFDIETIQDVCLLRVTHDGFEANSLVYEHVRQGWSAIICSLKTLLETGQPLPVAGNEKAQPEEVVS